MHEARSAERTDVSEWPLSGHNARCIMLKFDCDMDYLVLKYY